MGFRCLRFCGWAARACSILLLCGGAHLVLADERTLLESLRSSSLGVEPVSVRPSEIKGLYRVELESGEVIYATQDARYFLRGDIYEIGSSSVSNLTEQERSRRRLERVNSMPNEGPIVFPSHGETLASIVVFTDSSCVYCQRLHRDVPELNRRGVEVRYFAYPRSGVQSDTESLRQLKNAWCAADRRSALTALMEGYALPASVCSSDVVAEHYALGRDIGVRATPTIVSPSGQVLHGYSGVDNLLAALRI